MRNDSDTLKKISNFGQPGGWRGWPGGGQGGRAAGHAEPRSLRGASWEKFSKIFQGVERLFRASFADSDGVRLTDS